MKKPSANQEIKPLQQKLVDRLLETGRIQSAAVEAAFRAVPRHLFLPGFDLGRVYSDVAIPTKQLADGQAISSSSQPAMMAIMLEQLDLKPGQRVLEIGAGSGYNAALLAHLVGPSGSVITVDIDPEIVVGARQHLDAAGFERVQTICGDGIAGLSVGAPFACIILTVGTWDIAPAWVEQLQEGGKLVLPLALGQYGEQSVAFVKRDGRLISQSIESCGFMKLRGSLAAKSDFAIIPLGPEPGLILACPTGQVIDPDLVYHWLSGPAQDWDTGLEISRWESRPFGLTPWLRRFNGCTLRSFGPLADSPLVPHFAVKPGEWRFTSGVIGEQGVCLTMVSPDQPLALEAFHKGHRFRLYFRSYGPDQQLPRQLLAAIRDWDAAGRPKYKIERIQVFPPGAVFKLLPHQVPLAKRWTTLVLDLTYLPNN